MCTPRPASLSPTQPSLQPPYFNKEQGDGIEMGGMGIMGVIRAVGVMGVVIVAIRITPIHRISPIAFSVHSSSHTSVEMGRMGIMTAPHPIPPIILINLIPFPCPSGIPAARGSCVRAVRPPVERSSQTLLAADQAGSLPGESGRWRYSLQSRRTGSQ